MFLCIRSRVLNCAFESSLPDLIFTRKPSNRDISLEYNQAADLFIIASNVFRASNVLGDSEGFEGDLDSEIAFVFMLVLCL